MAPQARFFHTTSIELTSARQQAETRQMPLYMNIQLPDINENT